MPAISVMLKPASSLCNMRCKPASSLCNMRCKYCFYHSLAAQRSAPSHGMMSEETLKNVITKALDYADGAPVALSFQGGEPLLAGKGFFVKAEELIRTLNVKRSPVSVGVQTNGTRSGAECSPASDGLWGSRWTATDP